MIFLTFIIVILSFFLARYFKRYKDVVDEKTKLEKSLQQSEKLAVLGGLAVRAAHEIRNPLTVIHGFLTVLKQKSETKEWQVTLILKELDRMNAIVEDMLLMAKPGAPLLKEAYIEDILNGILPLYKSTTKNIHFNVDIKRVPLLLDPRQITQALYNLIRNSCEAMGGNGVITIESCIKNNRYCMYIKDTGSGIPMDIQDKIFDPFLTSKESGTGLGLTIIQRIIKNHNGTIELHSTSEAGTTFLISLPLG
jgi:signal transduction histidine kinase